ncbi:uncharacterized protein LOC128555857 [Mercenaria mercenaria]|uniref:uncharacterized protein LOC128555857 n=1 Tax=Mercenaria mercenaria TaxID=6596 RepID=UPI00234F0894|nr:uncharacterized protein LOC128555857 [Mercenaria mercenaria]
MAVLVGVRIMKFVEEQIKLPLDHVVLMTDSQCVLQWISSEKQLPVFVNNRVKEIRSHNNIDFRNVYIKDNSADIASRGCTLQILSEDQTWWHGPEWLCSPTHEWPQFKFVHRTEKESKCEGMELMTNTEEFKVNSLTDKQTSVVKKQEVGDSVINNENTPFGLDTSWFSSAAKLIRVTAWCLRFVRKLKGRKYDRNTPTSDALEEAENLWIKHVQRKHFEEVYNSIALNSPNSLAGQLDIFIDECGMLRCRGRLECANLSEATRYPMLLPRKERFTHLLVKNVHKIMHHCGVSQTLSEIRHRFWIPRGRATIRTILKLSTVCKRMEGGPYKLSQMAPLPKERVSESTPFSYVGLDYLGPLYIKENKESKKVWVCLFTCLVTRAVHLEIVRDMSASTFLLCLKKIIATRGTPKEIVSDNATQFRLSSETIKLVWTNLLQDDKSYASNEGMKWTFIIELAPWMGGFYERLVGIVKRALRKSIGRKLLMPDQMYTLLKEVEAVVNSRPIVCVGEDINSSIAITPSHFICLNPKTGILEHECVSDDPEFKPYVSSAERLLQIWKKGEQLLNRFWILWRDEYLPSLRERSQYKRKFFKNSIT